MSQNRPDNEGRKETQGQIRFDDVLAAESDDRELAHGSKEELLATREGLLGEPSEGGLDFEMMESYVNGTANKVTREIVESHMESDPSIREEVDQLMELRGQIELRGSTVPKTSEVGKGREIRFTWLGSLVGATGLAAAAVTTIIAIGPNANRIDSLSSQVASLSRDVADQRASFDVQIQSLESDLDSKDAEIRDLSEELEGSVPTTLLEQGNTRYVVSSDGTVERRQPVSGSAATLFNSNDLSGFAYRVQTAIQAGTTRSSDVEAVGITPVGTKVATDGPTFSWEPIKEAVRTQVVVETMNGDQVGVSPWLEGSRWESSLELGENVTYQWYLRVEDDLGVVQEASVVRDLPATFEVGSPSEWSKANALSQVDATVEGFVWLVESGYLDLAKTVLDKLIMQSPDEPTLSQWKQQLR